MDAAEVLTAAASAAIGPAAAVYALAAVGLNVHYGYTGLLNFGQAGFMLVGAYGAAVTVTVFGGSLWLGFIVGIALAAGLAIIVGVPTLHHRPVYLAIATIAAAEILVRVFHSGAARPFTGGVFGLEGFAGGFYAFNPIPPGHYTLLFVEAGSHERLWALLTAWALVLITSLLVWFLLRTPWGRVLASIRDDEDVARSLGKNVPTFKLQSLTLGGVIGALGGIMLALHEQTVHAASFAPVVTLFVYTVLVLGGAGRVIGPVIGAVLFTFAVTALDVFLTQAMALDIIARESVAPWFVQQIAVTAGLVLMLLFRPQGLLGRREDRSAGNA